MEKKLKEMRDVIFEKGVFFVRKFSYSGVMLPGIFALIYFTFYSCEGQAQKENYQLFAPSLIIQEANVYKSKNPVTITAFKAERSQGDLHDYYSEGPYWWENPEDPSGPYIRKDGERNPHMFSAHRSAIKELEKTVTTLTAAFLINGDEDYASSAKKHLDAWFVNQDTRMNPSLLYAQAIQGIASGRGIGIIDVIGLINVCNAIQILNLENTLEPERFKLYQSWFEDFALWLTEHPYGMDEQNNNNNHSSWWGAQVAAYSKLANRQDLYEIALEQFRNQLNIQLAANGSFPDEMHRTRPFHYMNYTMESWSTFALLASSQSFHPWEFEAKNGQLKDAAEFIYYYLENPQEWTFYTELETSIEPHAEVHLWMTYKGLNDTKFLTLWKSLQTNKKKAKPELLLWDYVLKTEKQEK